MKNIELERRWEVTNEIVLKNFIDVDKPDTLYIQNYLYSDGLKEDRIRKIMDGDTGDTIFKRTTKIGKGCSRLEISNRLHQTEWYLLNHHLVDNEDKKPLKKSHYEYLLQGEYLVEVSLYPFMEQKPIIEIEFNSEKEMDDFVPPNYFGKEITDMYSNIDIWKKLNGIEDTDEKRLISTGEYKGSMNPGYTENIDE